MEIKLNLLSETKKEEIRKKKRYRLVVWQELIIFSLGVFYVGTLLGVYSMLHLQTKNLETTNAFEKQEKAFQEIDAAVKVFHDTNERISQVRKFQREHTVWSNFFVALDNSVPDGIVLEKMSTSDSRISVSGKADTRETLLAFQERLKASPCFDDAVVPLSDLFAQDNVEFQLDISMKKECLKPGNL
jgi:Tfp pilus assembly protein PilN